MKKQKESYFVRLPYTKELFINAYTLTDPDIEKLKKRALSEGHTLGQLIAYHLKQLVK